LPILDSAQFNLSCWVGARNFRGVGNNRLGRTEKLRDADAARNEFLEVRHTEAQGLNNALYKEVHELQRP
jgi:hypothetical protein